MYSHRQPLVVIVHVLPSQLIALDHTEDLNTLMQEQQDICKDVTHAYLCAYVNRYEFPGATCSQCDPFRELPPIYRASCTTAVERHATNCSEILPGTLDAYRVSREGRHEQNFRPCQQHLLPAR